MEKGPECARVQGEHLDKGTTREGSAVRALDEDDNDCNIGLPSAYIRRCKPSLHLRPSPINQLTTQQGLFSVEFLKGNPLGQFKWGFVGFLLLVLVLMAITIGTWRWYETRTRKTERMPDVETGCAGAVSTPVRGLNEQKGNSPGGAVADFSTHPSGKLSDEAPVQTQK